MEIGHLGLL